ncbi:MAG: hypothetical protein IJP68_08210, partial [Selenomonadaceae bacterium]|nr:hypothetical protein [Selenomonadaceae bacterium]
ATNQLADSHCDESTCRRLPRRIICRRLPRRIICDGHRDESSATVDVTNHLRRSPRRITCRQSPRRIGCDG